MSLIFISIFNIIPVSANSEKDEASLEELYELAKENNMATVNTSISAKMISEDGKEIVVEVYQVPGMRLYSTGNSYEVTYIYRIDIE